MDTNTFVEMIAFQAKPDKAAGFEKLAGKMKQEQSEREGCAGIRYFRRFCTFELNSGYSL